MKDDVVLRRNEVMIIILDKMTKSRLSMVSDVFMDASV